MALITCPECGKKISDKAEACIGCGYPISKNNKNDKEYEDRIKRECEEIASEYFSKNLVKDSYEKHGWIPFLY